MSQDSSNPAGTPPGSSPGGPAAGRFDLRLLRRSRDDRMIGGVCGGLGRYVGIDPIIFRVVLAALAIFGGVGLLLYALAWLLIPDDGTDVSELHRLFQGHPSPAPIIAAIVVGVLGVITVTEVAYHRRGRFEVLLIVVAVIAVIAVSSRSHTAPPSTASYTRPPPYGTPPSYGTQPSYGTPAPPSATMPPTEAATPPPAYQAVAYPPPQYAAPQYSAPRYTAPLGPPAGFSPSRPVYTPPPNYVPPPPKPPRPPSFLGPIALSVGIVIVGVLLALNASHSIDLSAQAIFATSLLIVGVALVVGTWIGRARVLIAVGAVLAIALAIVAAIDVPLRGGIGDRDYAPTSATDIPPTYRLAIGHQTIDLNALDLAGKTVQVTSSVGIGEIDVRVPPNVRLVVHGRVGTGDVNVGGDDNNSGSHVDRTLVLPAIGSAVGGEIDLDLRVGLGRVFVDREVPAFPVTVVPVVPVTPTAAAVPTTAPVPTAPVAPTLGSGQVTQP